MKLPTFLKQIISICGILLLLSACGTHAYAPLLTSPTNPQVSQAVLGPTPTAGSGSALVGSVVLEEGRCCIGGFAGDKVLIQAKFSAVSQFGKVTEMRMLETATCEGEPKMEAAAWEPFAPSKTFPVVVSINWTGFNISVQFRDDHQNLSPVYCDDISVEGSARPPSVNPTDWYAQIQCFADNEVQPGPGETVTDTTVVFRWPDKNHLPDGVFYKVSAFSAVDHYTGLVATGQTKQTTLALRIQPEEAGDMVWYVTLADINGTFLDHGRCSSFAASLLTANPPDGIKGIHFNYEP